MIKAIGDYNIKVEIEPYARHSIIDNSWNYDSVYLDKLDETYSVLIGIKVYEGEYIVKSALIGANGGGTGISDTSFLVKADRILLCCCDTIFCLSLPSLSLLWKTQADPATCFQIFSYKDDYIIHGELEITRLNKDGQILWQRSGADIFTTLNFSKEDFMINENFILATDWGNRKYKFDFDGSDV